MIDPDREVSDDWPTAPSGRNWIFCPNCGHDIEEHGDKRHMNIHPRRCMVYDEGKPACGCPLTPADIAHALLTAEPTEAEMEAGAEALFEWDILPTHPWPKPRWSTATELTKDMWRVAARSALKAAKEARR